MSRITSLGSVTYMLTAPFRHSQWQNWRPLGRPSNSVSIHWVPAVPPARALDIEACFRLGLRLHFMTYACAFAGILQAPAGIGKVPVVPAANVVPQTSRSLVAYPPLTWRHRNGHAYRSTRVGTKYSFKSGARSVGLHMRSASVGARWNDGGICHQVAFICVQFGNVGLRLSRRPKRQVRQRALRDRRRIG